VARTVLMVDGAARAGSGLRGCLAAAGYQVVRARRAEQVLEVLGGAAVDAVLLDVRLPGMDGLETLEQIRRAFPQLPVVMISGPGTLAASARAVGRGAFDYVEKPVTAEKLRIVLAHALEQRDLRAENRELKGASAPFDIGDFRRATLAFEKEYLERKLRENAYNVSRTAERLGLDRTSIHRKMKQLGIAAAGGRH
jgi:DNA-binding NtrC family response regulator